MTGDAGSAGAQSGGSGGAGGRGRVAGSGGSGGTGGTLAAGGTGGTGGTSSAGTFVPPTSCTTDDQCDDDNPCTDQQCDSAGECQYSDNTASCDDGDACTSADACAEGECRGTPACGDGCDTACPEPIATPVAAGGTHTCARRPDGAIRCWGSNNRGQLGYPPDTTPGGDVDVGGPVVQLALGGNHSCALLEDSAVRCWGSNGDATLGYGNSESIGDDPGETPASAGDVDVGGPALHIDAELRHTCVALVDGSVRCWGEGGAELGYGDGDTSTVGEEQTPAERGVVDVGGRAVQVAVGGAHTCALLDNGLVRCWGGPSYLGHLAQFPVGDNETPGSAPTLDLGGKATQIAAGNQHTCALLEDKTVRCWGFDTAGELGYGDGENVGDDETPAEKGPVDIGGPATQITVGLSHTCALLEDKTVRCWGNAAGGRLGYGNLEDIGDDETPGSLPNPVDVGGDVIYISAGTAAHTCAVLVGGAVRCWGNNTTGALGYAGTQNIGDDEAPASAGDVSWLD